MAKLYEIVAELQDFVTQNEGLEDEQAYKDTLEGLQGELDDKVGQWCRCIKNLEGERDAKKAEAQRLQSGVKALDNNIDRMKQTLMAYMQLCGRKNAGDQVISAKIVKNGGQAPVEVDIAPEELPARFKKVTIEADKNAIREALTAGEEFSFARLGERGEHIKIG